MRMRDGRPRDHVPDLVAELCETYWYKRHKYDYMQASWEKAEKIRV